MRITSFVSTLLVVFAGITLAQAQHSVVSSDGTSIRSSASHSRTRLDIRTRVGKRYALFLSRDSTISAGAQPTAVNVVGEIKGTAIIITDSYPSIPGGMSYCQAGEERFLRVISTSKKRPTETLRMKIESCRENLELDSTGIEWSPESSTLRIRWLAGPAIKGAPEVRTIRIGPEGKPI
jgi:hypothetical protein